MCSGPPACSHPSHSPHPGPARPLTLHFSLSVSSPSTAAWPSSLLPPHRPSLLPQHLSHLCASARCSFSYLSSCPSTPCQPIPHPAFHLQQGLLHGSSGLEGMLSHFINLGPPKTTLLPSSERHSCFHGPGLLGPAPPCFRRKRPRRKHGNGFLSKIKVNPPVFRTLEHA